MTALQTVSGGKTYRRLLTYLKEVKGIFIISVLGMMLLAFVEMNLARIMGPLLEVGFIKKDIDAIKLVMLQLTILFVVRGFAGLTVTYLSTRIARTVIYTLRQQLFAKLLALPTRQYDQSTSGEFVSMMSYNTEQVAQSTTSVITSLVKDSLTILFLVGLMLYVNATISVLFLVCVPLVAIVMRAVTKRLRTVSHRIQDSMSDSTQIVEEIIDGHKVVKVFCGQTHELNKFATANRNNKRQNIKLGLVKGLTEPFVQVIALGFLLSLIYIAVFMESIKADQFIQLVSAILLIFPAMKRLTNVNVALQRGIAAAQTIFHLLDSPEEDDEGTEVVDRAAANIQYQQVSFAYESGNNILKNINLDIRTGQTIAFVGRSGSGKSTLVNLLPRMYSGFSGNILLDGKAIQDYQLQNLRQQISYVGQQVTLFNDTVANNIAYGHQGEFSREQIEAAAEAANCKNFIDNMEQGFDTLIGEDGVLLSGGQRQRLAIARALLKDAPILILDEATSALDSESEEKIQIALERLMRNRTTLVIAHRLSTVENADHIVVMDNGVIVEQGDHKALLDANGQYASLYNLQFNTDAIVDEPEKAIASEAVSQNIVQYHQRGHNYLKPRPGTNIFENMWYGAHPMAMFMVPLSWLYGLLVVIRRRFYKFKLFTSYRAPVPVVIVGNLTVGGTGKTPLVIWLAKFLKKMGLRVGIISRGYKGQAKQWPLLVDQDTDPTLSGDEAVIIATGTGCPVAVGPNRKDSIQLLLKEHDCNIIISDDGLQHYALQRDIEILVTDGARGFGNGILLPAGPMREPRDRIKQCDFIVANGATLPDAYSMFMAGEKLFDLAGQPSINLSDLAGQTVHAVAAIGNPERFFDLLRIHQLQVIEHPMPDHADFTLADITFDDYPVIMTEKDWVKCKQFLPDLQNKPVYYLPVQAQLDEAFENALQQKVVQSLPESIDHKDS